MRELLLLFCLATAAPTLIAENYYVSKTGVDSNPGSYEMPFLTLVKAASVMLPGDTCFVREGVYQEELVVTRSGQSGSPIVFQAYRGDSVLISATDTVKHWVLHEGSIYKTRADLPLGRQNMLFFDRKTMDPARWPDNSDGDPYTIDAADCDGGSASTIIGSGIPAWDWTGGYVWYLGAHSGASWTRPVTGFDSLTGTIGFPAVDISKWPFNPHNPTVFRNGNRGRFYLFGILEALDHPGEWWYDSATDTLYFQSPGNADPNIALTEAARRENTIHLAGSFIHLDGIHAFGGRVRITGDHCVIRNGTFRHCLEILDELDNTDAQIGNGSVLVEGSNIVIENNTIEYGSANGICCSFAWKGSSNITIRNNYIRHFNTVGNHSGPIRANVTGMKIIGNTIYSCGRDGVYNSGTYSEIAWNDISDCMKINNDGGVFYTVGNSGSKNTEIHHNWVHDSYGPSYADGRAAGIYLDNDSKGYLVHHNVVWNVTWSAVQMNWDNWYNNIFNNSFWNVGAAMGNWLNGRELIDNKIYNNYSPAGPWIGNDFRNNVIDPVSPFTDLLKRDFTPVLGSPLFDAGIQIPGITEPFIGAAPDVGSYEFGLSPWRPGVNREEGGDTLVSLQLRILNPRDNQTIVSPSHVDVVLEANSREGISYTSLYLDGILVSHDSMPPYSWESSVYPVLSGLGEGEHTLRASASDINGVSFQDLVTFRVVRMAPGDTVSLGKIDSSDVETDPWTSNMVINESRAYTNLSDTVLFMRTWNFNFTAHRNADPVTPFIVRVNQDNDFTVLAIGTTRNSSEYAPGNNRFRFREQADTILVLDPGETIAPGFLDAYPDGTGGGAGSVIPYNHSPPLDEIWWTGGTFLYHSGKVFPGMAPVVKTLSKTYLRMNYQFSLDFIIMGGISTAVPFLSEGSRGKITVYPNPVVNTPLRIRSEDFSSARLSIYDMQGRPVFRTVMEEGFAEIPVSALPASGLYVLFSASDNGVIRVIVSRQ